MQANVANLVWEKVRLINRLPGAHASYKAVTGLLYRDGKKVTLRRGPATGYRWRHYSCYQPWMAMGLYEPHVARLIHDALEPGQTFYDIGANAGYFTLIAAKAVGARGRVIAFDPQPRNVQTVKEQVALNGLESVCHVEPLAISDRCGAARFVLTEVNANAHLREIGAPHVADEGRTIEVRTVTLDAYVEDQPWPDFIKMDIEGAEVAALNAAGRLLSSPRAPRCLISTHSDELDRGVKRIFSRHGYTFENLQGFEQMVYALPPRSIGEV